MKQENYLKVLDKKKNNEEAQQVNIKSIEEEIKKYLRQQEQERNVEITTNELKNKIIMFVSEHIENWNLDKDYVNQEGMIDTNKLIGKIFDDILNYGIIQKLVEDPEVTEINSNGRYIFYEIKGRRRPAYDERGARIKFSSPEEQETCITTLIGNNDITFDNRNRLINVKTYEGYRLSATYKTARTQVNKVGEDDYSDFTLRKFKEIPYTLKELCKMHTLTDNMARIMKMTVNNTTHVFCGVVGSGKAVTYDTDIITPTGKIKARDIKVGDIVYDGLGNETKILGVYPQPKQDIYRIKFIDGYVDTSLDHINTLYKLPPYKLEKERKEGEPFCDEDTFRNDVIDYMGNAKEELRIDITTKELLKMTRREWTKLYMVRPSKLCKEWREKESLSIRPVIENIEKKEQQEECVCFMVESSHHTYLVNDYVVTHNTYSVKAIATELQIPLYVLDVAGLLEGVNPLKNIKEVFDFVRDKKNQPCILFMDECDSIVMSRNRSDIEPQMLRATNVVLQTINEENEDLSSDLVIFSATNLVHKIDDAFKSRFGLQMEYPLPDDYAEQTKMLMKGKEFEYFNLIDDLDDNDKSIVNRRARQSEFSTRELKKKILEECEELALRNIENGRPLQKLDIKLSAILQRVAIHVKLALKLKSIKKEED